MSRPGWLLTPGRVPYADAYRLMHDLAERRVREEIPDTLILLEHPPVYTAGRRTDPAHLGLVERDAERMGAEVHHVDRGGSVTFHGPGQLVGYPIIRLPGRGDVIRYLRDLEEVILRTAATFGAGCERSEVNTGVWSGRRKMCAIGIRTTRGVTLHGFALNCTTDLRWFQAIVPCGLPGYGVVTLSELAGREVTVRDVLPEVAGRFAEVFDLDLHAAVGLQEMSRPPEPSRLASLGLGEDHTGRASQAKGDNHGRDPHARLRRRA